VDYELDVCAITDTWLSQDADQIDCRNIIPTGFRLHRVPRTTSRGGGIAILYNTNLSAKCIKLQPFTTFEVMEMLLYSTKLIIRIIAICRPLGNKSVTSYNDEFEQCISNHATNGRDLLKVGDFNVHVEDRRDNNAVSFRLPHLPYLAVYITNIVNMAF